MSKPTAESGTELAAIIFDALFLENNEDGKGKFNRNACPSLSEEGIRAITLDILGATPADNDTSERAAFKNALKWRLACGVELPAEIKKMQGASI